MFLSRISTWMVAAVAVGTLSAACGGAGASGGDGVATADGAGANAKNTSANKKSDPQQAGLDFARCMREHGVDMPDPEPGQGGFAVRIGGGPADGATAPSASGSAGFSSGPTGAVSLDDNGAFEECRHFLDDAIAASDMAPDPEMADRALKFAQCMREHGVNMPDPQVNGGAVSIVIGGPGGDGIDPNSPTLQAAHEACGAFFGPGGEGPAGATKGGPAFGYRAGSTKS